jgi:hypothetical protein
MSFYDNQTVDHPIDMLQVGMDPQAYFKDVARKPVEVVEVPVRVDVPVPVEVPVSVSRRGSSSGLLPPDSVGPFDIQGQNMPNRPIRRPLNPDPVTVVNSPPSDSEFVNRVRFDRNNVNLLQPPVDQSTASGFQNSFPNTNMRQMPFQQNAQVPFQNQPGGNSWGLMNPNLQNVGQTTNERIDINPPIRKSLCSCYIL